MSAVPQIKDYYESYWANGKNTFSGSRQGYASNFRNWMRRELAGVPREAPILEVGCGDGSFTAELANFSTDVTAIDISAGQVAENAVRFPAIRFQQHDVAATFPFPDESFDVVWCSEVLEHLLDPGFALAEMCRVIKPGGRLLVTVPYHGRFKNVMIALFKWDEHFVPTNPHIRFFTKKTLGRLASEAGFAHVQMDSCGMGVPVRDMLIPTNILLRATRPS